MGALVRSTVSKRRLAALACGLVGVAGALMLRSRLVASRAQRAASLERFHEVHGDADLAAEVLSLLPKERVFACAVGLVTPEPTRLASIGVPLGATFEIGSIGKGVTGLLYQQALDRGEVSAQSRLGDYCDLGDAPAARVLLSDLAQHRSGLPAHPDDVLTVARTVLRVIRGENPSKGEGVADVLASARKVRVRCGGSQNGLPPTVQAKAESHGFSYSNYGYALLGHALATAAGLGYADLVAQRVSAHLDRGVFYAPAMDDPRALDAQAVQGYSSNGHPVKPWMDLAYAPAGGIRADIGAMTAFAQRLCEGTMPGAKALEPTFTLPPFTSDSHAPSAAQASASPDQMGWAWFTSEVEGRTIVWHNGATGGFTSWIGCDRERGSAVVVLAATNEPVDEAGEHLLLHHG